MAYCIPPFSVRPGRTKQRSSVSASGLSMRVAIIVERSFSLPPSSKTGLLSVISSSNTTPKAYTSTFGVTGPASRHSGCCQEEYCCLLHHCARMLGLRSCGDREVHWQHQVQYGCVGSSSLHPGILSCSAIPGGSRLPYTRTRAKTSPLKVPRYPWSFILLLDPKSLVAFLTSENLYTLRIRSSFAISRIKSFGEGTSAFLPLPFVTCVLLLRD